MASEKKAIDAHSFDHPLLKRLTEMAAKHVGIQLTFVYPSDSGWGQVCGQSSSATSPEFCKMIQSTPEGAKHCRICHILLTVAACGGGQTQQRCHAGLEVIVTPAISGSSEAIAVLSSCTFTHANIWSEARAKGEKLGINLDKLHKAYLGLPRLDPAKREQLRAIMEAACAAIDLIRQNGELEAKLQSTDKSQQSPAALVGKLLKSTNWAQAPSGEANGDSSAPPLMIRVVCEMVRQRPDLSYSVKELASAVRLTPNHFTASFHRHTGKPFTTYLLEQRIERAKKLLGDLTLNVGEVARLVGYDDAGYFTRRFHKATKLSPRAWRNRHCIQPRNR
jgi:AraC-like DNA-binding protein